MGRDWPSITCPVCVQTSYNPTDVTQGYCGSCHDWTARRPHGNRHVDRNSHDDARAWDAL